MLLVRLVVCFHSLNYYFICAKIVTPFPQTVSSLKTCLDQIQDQYFNPSDLIIFLNLNQEDLKLNVRPIIIQSNYTKRLQFYNRVKADGYLITISENIIKNVFEKLARTSQWNPRAKFLIILKGDPSGLFKVLKKYYILNVVVFILKSRDEIEMFTIFPFDYSVVAAKRADPILQDVCFKGKVRNNVDLFPQKLPGKWNNFTMKVITLNYPPYVICRDCKDEKMGGLELQIFNLVQQILGFKIEYVNKSYDGWGTLQSNGSFSGGYGDLQNLNADMGIGLFFANFTEIWNFDLSYPYMEDSYKWVVPIADLQPQWMGVVKIYGTCIWIFIIISTVLVSSLLYFFSTSPSELKNYRNITTSFLICLQCLMGQFVKQPKTAMTRCVLIGWVVFSWLIMAAFQSHLTSALNFNKYEAQISNVQELIDSKLKFGFYDAAGGLFLHSDNKLDSYIYQNYMTCHLNLECFNRTAFQKDFATIKVGRQIEFYIIHYYLKEDGKSLIYVLNEQVSNILINMAFARGFPMFEKVNKLLINMKSSGFIQRLYNDMKNFVQMKYSRAEQLKQTANQLEFRELKGFFYMLLIGWFVSFMVFITEIIVAKKSYFKLKLK